MKKFWNKNIETMPLHDLKKLQLKNLKHLIKWVYSHNHFYRERLSRAGIQPDSIKTLEDIRTLPLLNKDDLRQYYPFGLTCVPMEKIIAMHASSGTTGKPVVGVYTHKDMAIWTEAMARSLWANGLRNTDIMQNSYGYGFFTGARGHELGAQAIGAMTIPISSGNTKRQLMMMKDLGATALAATPSYTLYMAEVAEEEGYTQDDFHIRLGFLGAEAWSEEMRTKIEKKWGMRACEQYGLTELIGPGVSLECSYRQGLHINADHFFTEIIDPVTGETKGEGEQGELVFTTLTKEAFPVLRFRTGDIASYTEELCNCGRTFPRHSRILGRADDRMKIKGVLTFPSQIEEAIMMSPGASENYQIVKSRHGSMYDYKVVVEPTTDYYTNGKLEFLQKKIIDDIHTILNIRLPVTIVPPGTLPRSEGKAKRVIEK
ncbi:MAG TPA: phenylacetate--CoA ligase [Desulfobacterales bacterium]|nr:phenylacetate--CoA ligase [Desulfobacterales bacterium]